LCHGRPHERTYPEEQKNPHNDILEWVPNQDQVSLDTPLQQLRFKPEPYFDQLLNKLDYGDQLELQRLMEERIAQKKGAAEKGAKE